MTIQNLIFRLRETIRKLSDSFNPFFINHFAESFVHFSGNVEPVNDGFKILLPLQVVISVLMEPKNSENQQLGIDVFLVPLNEVNEFDIHNICYYNNNSIFNKAIFFDNESMTPANFSLGDEFLADPFIIDFESVPDKIIAFNIIARICEYNYKHTKLGKMEYPRLGSFCKEIAFALDNFDSKVLYVINNLDSDANEIQICTIRRVSNKWELEFNVVESNQINEIAAFPK